MSLLDVIGVWLKPKKYVSPLRECRGCFGTGLIFQRHVNVSKKVVCPYCIGGLVRIEKVKNKMRGK